MPPRLNLKRDEIISAIKSGERTTDIIKRLKVGSATLARIKKDCVGEVERGASNSHYFFRQYTQADTFLENSF